MNANSLNYFTIVNSIRFSVSHYLVDKSGLTGSFLKSRLGCVLISENTDQLTTLQDLIEYWKVCVGSFIKRCLRVEVIYFMPLFQILHGRFEPQPS